MRNHTLWLACTLISALSAVPAPADDLGETEAIAVPDDSQAAATDGEEGSAGAPAADDAQVMPLSLAEAIQLALQNNLDVEVQRFGPLLGAEGRAEARGAFDPEFFADFGYSDIDRLSSFTFENSIEDRFETIDGFGGFRGLLPMLGSEYKFQFDGQRTETTATFQSLNPEYRSSFSLDLTQPLLRDLIWNAPWTRVKSTRLLYEESLEEFRRQVMDTVQQVEDGYWNLVATAEQKNVAEKSLETAQTLLDQTKIQYEVGVVSKVEVVEADAGVADREVNLIREDNIYLAAQDALGNFILGSGFTADSNLHIEPTDRPEDFTHFEVDFEGATQRAFQHRPELAIIDDEIERQSFEKKFANNQRLPSLDLKVGYGNRGLAGDTATSSSNFGNSLDHFLTNDAADQFSARAVFSIPIPNTAARARASMADLELRRIHTQRRRMEQVIILEVRNAVRNMKSTYEGIKAARRSSEASAEQLRAERIRLEYGESTPFAVLQREEDYVDAQSREINALRLYRISVTGLNRAQGSILSNRNIAIDAVHTLR